MRLIIVVRLALSTIVSDYNHVCRQIARSAVRWPHATNTTPYGYTTQARRPKAAGNFELLARRGGSRAIALAGWPIAG